MTDRMVIRKWIWAWDFDKEEDWLNEMAMSGWALCRVGFCSYEFERCEPGEYIVRLQFSDDDAGFTAFMEDIGAEHIGRIIKWHYYRRKSCMGPFDMFSDIDSKIAHLDRIGKLISGVGMANLIIGIANSINAVHFGWINLLAATLLMYGLGRIHGKKEALEKDGVLRE